MRFLTHQWVLSLVCWCVSLICLFCFPWLTQVTLEMVDRSHSKIKSFFVDFVQERQVYLHDQAFFNLKVHFTELSTSSGFWFHIQHQLSVSLSSWYALPESVFMALGSASIFVPALSLRLKASQTQLLLWLWCTSTSCWRWGSKREDVSRSPVPWSGHFSFRCVLKRLLLSNTDFKQDESSFPLWILLSKSCLIVDVLFCLLSLQTLSVSVLMLQHE